MGDPARGDEQVERHEQVAEPQAGADASRVDDRAADCLEVVRIGCYRRRARRLWWRQFGGPGLFRLSGRQRPCLSALPPRPNSVDGFDLDILGVVGLGVTNPRRNRALREMLRCSSQSA